MGYVACLSQIPEETAHVLQNLVSANGLTNNQTASTELCRYSHVTNILADRVRNY